MNELGILIDITHATAEAQAQIIATSRTPVVASHMGLAAVSGPGGLSDETLRALARSADATGRGLQPIRQRRRGSVQR